MTMPSCPLTAPSSRRSNKALIRFRKNARKSSSAVVCFATMEREPDLTGIFFENTTFPLSQESWYQWLSLSSPNGFFDTNPRMEMTLDLPRCEEPRLYVVTKRVREGKREPRMKLFIHDAICYQAPPVQRVGLGRLNNAAYYVSQAMAKLLEKKRKIEAEEQDDDEANKKKKDVEEEKAADVAVLRALDEELVKQA